MDYSHDFATHPVYSHDFGVSGAPELQQQPPHFHHDFETASMQEHQQYTLTQAGQKMSCDVKPRLTKEQHDILEAHYQKQQKPNTSTKRGFAEALNVSLEKVNNWFQNRRAKSKQDAKKHQGPPGLYSVSQPSQISLGTSDSDTSPAFVSTDYLQMMQQCEKEEELVVAHPLSSAYEQPQPHTSLANPQLLAATAENFNMIHPSHLADLQELNRRTLTQEQFDAIAQQELMLNSGDLAMLSHDPEVLSKILAGYHDFSEPAMEYSAADLMQEHVISAPSSEWSDSRSSSASLPHSFEQHHITTPLEQHHINASLEEQHYWQPGQSVPVNFDQLNQEFHKAAQAAEPVWPELIRRESSTSLITQSMGNVGLHTPQTTQAAFKPPTPVSSLAARRQRARPAPLALRSQSYSGTVQPLASPGSMAPPCNTPPQLRRIKSSNVVAQGRVQKNIAPPQRSPLNWTFSDAMISPQAVRHQSSHSTSALITSTSISPPENEATRLQQQWQAKSIERISETDAEHVFTMPVHNFSSPPHTPMFHPAQQQQFMPPPMLPGNMIMENTPPQSAPASQQYFPQSTFGQSPQQIHYFQQPVMFHPMPPQMVMPQPQPVQQPTMHMLEEHQMMAMAQPHFTVTTSGPPMDMPMHFAQNGVPIVDAQGQISLAMPSQMQFVQQRPQRTDLKPGQIPPGSQTTFSINPELPVQITAQVPKHSTQQSTDFFVHEYTPPQDVKRDTSPRKNVDSGPKNYTFANQTPEHFEKGKNKASTSPDSIASV